LQNRLFCTSSCKFLAPGAAKLHFLVVAISKFDILKSPRYIKKGGLMRKVLLTLWAIIVFGGSLFPDERKTAEEFNNYGGKTFEITIDEENIEKMQYSKMQEYYNFAGELVKRIITPSAALTNESCIKEQIDHFKNDIIEKYEMTFTDAFKVVHDFNRESFTDAVLRPNVNFRQKRRFQNIKF
jgi:hypothetical protein